jgi:hypothetical protein
MINGVVVSKSQISSFKVVEKLQEYLIENFRDILAKGDYQLILEFLSNANLMKQEKGFSF